MKSASTFRLTAIWLFLLAATGATFALGEVGGNAGYPAAMAMLAIAFLKCRFVAWDFMGLRPTSRFWRGLILGWLLLVVTLIAIAFRMGAHP